MPYFHYFQICYFLQKSKHNKKISFDAPLFKVWVFKILFTTQWCGVFSYTKSFFWSTDAGGVIKGSNPPF